MQKSVISLAVLLLGEGVSCFSAQTNNSAATKADLVIKLYSPIANLIGVPLQSDRGLGIDPINAVRRLLDATFNYISKVGKRPIGERFYHLSISELATN